MDQSTWGSFITKDELLLESNFFALNFLPWEFLLVKELEIKKTNTTLKLICIIKLVLFFLISNFFTDENSQGWKSSAV